MSHQRDIKRDAALEGINDTPEDITNRAKGYKANLSNPNTSEESKQHSRQALESLGGEEAFYGKKEVEKDPTRVAAGLKSTINQSKPEVSDEARQSAQERLDKM
ncbi:uncharacterized protein EI97DRAFT_393659 [Westerdykella ornata]|uniref:Conidiation protein 6 n=1 Tax=Westerdykella ornata TaxID=318751 RepID=A0A6A6JRK4_WESOR|nr:uncharacterized protein EI97DRAFT_393659 [Westerdykella ornata]KAF2278875.1 hypothetical protein EI97DRAFT_393659 [Westerdykella ornata]